MSINLEFACIHLQYFLSSTYYLSQFRGEYTGEEDKSRDVITYAIHFMRENLGKKILVDDIARAAGLSTTYFSTFFQKQTGSSPISYLNNLRIQQGCQYLDFTDLKINQICHKIGYEDPYYFSRIFTKIMGMAPKEYRKREKG
ncbi:MAG: AraC family transcriptional regulator [Tannerellaceae bacterium]|nr:AraC family transcriptional regulator [Tannerellaceae bacterium]